MMIIDDYNIVVSCEEMLAGNRSAKKFEKIVRTVCEEGSRLIKPKSAVRYLSVKDIGEDGVVRLAGDCGEYSLYVGSEAGYLSPAAELLICVNTVGSDITDKIEEYDRGGDTLLAYYLDIFGVRAITAVTAEIRRIASDRAAAAQCGVGPLMQPGSTGNWPVTGQRDIFELTGAAEMGVCITDGSMLRPRISDSMIIGIGNYTSEHVDSLCPDCQRYKTCLWRRENHGA